MLALGRMMVKKIDVMLWKSGGYVGKPAGRSRHLGLDEIFYSLFREEAGSKMTQVIKSVPVIWRDSNRVANRGKLRRLRTRVVTRPRKLTQPISHPRARFPGIDADCSRIRA